MPIYRAEQARLSISSEPGLGGYIDDITASTDATAWNATINMANGLLPGSKTVTFDTATGSLAVGDYILIGDGSTSGNREIRRIASLGEYSGAATTGTIYLDYPVGFFHADNEILDEKTVVGNEGTPVAGSSFATFLPGVYETIETPDIEPELLPQYYLSTVGTRNWSYLYRGSERFAGSLPNMILLSGVSLRFPIGTVRTIASAYAAAARPAFASAQKGSRLIRVDLSVGGTINNGELIEIETAGTNPEIRRVTSGGGGVLADTPLILNYPMMFDHTIAFNVRRVDPTATFTHRIIETPDLDSMTWNLLMRDSGEAAANDFIRKYVGGVCNTAVLFADEGGLLRFSFDDTQFTDIVHNQILSSVVSGAAPTNQLEKSSAALIQPPGIGDDYPSTGGVLGTPTYPTREPYYFSQGELSFFGVVFARVRNFRLQITNNVEPRMYIRNYGGARGPNDMQPLRREYALTATIAMNDSISWATGGASSTTRSLWKEFITESNYGSWGGTTNRAGFNMVLSFTRGPNDTIFITSPPNSPSDGAAAAPTNAFQAQGCFFRRARHAIADRSPVEVEGEIIIRTLGIRIIDSIGVYP